MGRDVMPLPLYGVARVMTPALEPHNRHALRVRAPSCEPTVDDVALVRSVGDLEIAAGNGFSQVLALSDDEQLVRESTAFTKAYGVSAQFSYLSDGDVIGIDPRSGRFRVHYLVTERCNHYCLMCSQPPKDVDDRWILKEIRSCLPLIDRGTRSLGFTGGEPLLDWEDFIDVLGLCRDHLPNTSIHVLSNGRAFAQSDVVAAWAGLRHSALMVGIPLYASVDHVHDYVVQAAGAFDETVLGILKLKDRGARVEVRVVLHSVTIPHLVETCRWFARNLPFVDHVALMGLENTGFAIANDSLLWIDPIDYQQELARSVESLVSAGVRVSVYNLPLCVIPGSVRRFAVRSISDWKNGYAGECDRCDEQKNCSGMFTSGRPKVSRGIRAIVP
jgi:His-Xaa-Ser system radical SAM maturase HxsC